VVFFLQIHLAAASGNVRVLQWLIDDMHCCIKDVNTGDNLVNASGHTVLAVAARRGDKETMRYAVHTLRCSTADVTDVAVLQRGLHAALEVSTRRLEYGVTSSNLISCFVAIFIGTRSAAVADPAQARPRAGRQRAPL
jgi:hypothetical protein